MRLGEVFGVESEDQERRLFASAFALASLRREGSSLIDPRRSGCGGGKGAEGRMLSSSDI